MLKRTTGLSLLVIVVVLLAACDSGLTAEDEADIETVAQAFQTFAGLESARTSTEGQITQDMSVMGMPLSLDMNVQSNGVQSLQGGGAGDSDLTMKMDMNINMSSMGQAEAMRMTVDVRQVGGRQYMRMRDISGGGALTGDMQGMMSQDWIEASNMGNLGTMDASSFSNLAGLDAMPTVSMRTVTDINHEDTRTLNGQPVDVYWLRLDAAALREAMSSDAFSQMLNLDSLASGAAQGIDFEGFVDDLFDDMTLEMRVWIGQRDNLIYALENDITLDAELTLQGQSMQLEQDLQTFTVFQDHNVPVRVTAPR